MKNKMTVYEAYEMVRYNEFYISDAHKSHVIEWLAIYKRCVNIKNCCVESKRCSICKMNKECNNLLDILEKNNLYSDYEYWTNEKIEAICDFITDNQ